MFHRCCRYLTLSTNNIEKISSLSGLDNLKTLSLGRNQIKKIENLDSVAETLEELWISYNLLERLVRGCWPRLCDSLGVLAGAGWLLWQCTLKAPSTGRQLGPGEGLLAQAVCLLRGACLCGMGRQLGSGEGQLPVSCTSLRAHWWHPVQGGSLYAQVPDKGLLAQALRCCRRPCRCTHLQGGVCSRADYRHPMQKVAWMVDRLVGVHGTVVAGSGTLQLQQL